MVLVDTSVWIDFLRSGDDLLREFLEKGAVVTHPFIIGELTCGHISKREKFLTLINDVPLSKIATDQEVVSFINTNKVYGKGVGYIDLHILCSSILSNIPLWTKDKRLAKISQVHHASL